MEDEFEVFSWYYVKIRVLKLSLSKFIVKCYVEMDELFNELVYWVVGMILDFFEKFVV